MNGGDKTELTPESVSANNRAESFDDKNTSAKFFGHRSRNMASRSRSARADAELVATKRIADNPNNPEFFRQAAQNEVGIQSVRRQSRRLSKKPLIIGVGLVAILVIIVAGILIAKGRTSSGGNTPDERLANLADLANNYYDSVKFFESINDIALEGAFVYDVNAHTKEEYEEYDKDLKDNFERVKAFRNKLSDFGKIDVKDLNYSDDNANANVYLSDLKASLDKRIGTYESYTDLFSALYQVYATYGDADSIKKVEEVSGSQEIKSVADDLRDYYNRYNHYVEIAKNNKCPFSKGGEPRSNGTPVCEKNADEAETLTYDMRENNSGLGFALSTIAVKGNDKPTILMNKIIQLNNSYSGEEDV